MVGPYMSSKSALRMGQKAELLQTRIVVSLRTRVMTARWPLRPGFRSPPFTVETCFRVWRSSQDDAEPAALIRRQ